MIPMLRHILRGGMLSEPAPHAADHGIESEPQARQLADDLQRILGRALAIRQVDAGSCNGCELEVHALENPYYNLGAYGVKFVASPRHADVLLVTGPVTKNMEHALREAWECMPAPKWVVAAGDCAASGGIFGASYASCGGLDGILPVSVRIPGCPPTPAALLAGLLTLAGRMEKT